MKQLKTKILDNKKITQDFYKMRLEAPYLAKTITPGQFVEVRCSDDLEPFLRRPFSVHRILKDEIEILYEVVGKGTQILAQKKKGEYLDIIGPLGKGFVLPPQTANRKPQTVVLIAGGIGVAPLLALAERMAHRKKAKPYILIGAKTKNHILCEKDFRKLGFEVLISTEDGSKGKKGFVTELLYDVLNAKRYTLYAKIHACGPVGMLKEVARIAREYRIPCQVSLEERMACGVGVCLGCPVRVRKSFTKYEIVRSEAKPPRRGRDTDDEYKMVCKDGPVFNAEEIAW